LRILIKVDNKLYACFYINTEGGEMELLDELRICIIALEKLKNSCLEKSMEINYGNSGFADLIASKYIAYASCQSILIELVDKYLDIKSIIICLNRKINLM